MLNFPTQPSKTLQELEQKLFRLVPQLERKTLENYEVGTGMTAIAHGLPGTPRIVNPRPHSLCMWCEAAPADTKCIYLRASAVAVFTIEVAL